MIKQCPCCSGKLFSVCCQPFLSGKSVARTAKQLMRSRYCAFAIGGLGDYLLQTWHPDTRPEVSADELGATDTEWTGLEIINSTQHGDNGTVEFKARFIGENGALQIHHENSLFLRNRGQWHYVRAISHEMVTR